MKKEITNILYTDIKYLIEKARSIAAQTVNENLTLLYWNIGKRINDEILKNKRADYGKKIITSLAKQLEIQYGKGFSPSALTRMCLFNEKFSDFKIIATLSHKLSWSHFVEILPLKDDIQRDFYVQMCRLEQWSVRTLRKKIDSMLYERTSISKKPERLVRLELQQLKEDDALTPDLVFRDPYVLDFLNLKNAYQEKDLEMAIIRELESFVLELGIGFTFVARQKRMIIDNEDFYLDLLFYHRKLKRLVAIELKLGKFKSFYKGQMELYLKWLEKHEMEEGEELPIGLILCSERKQEQIQLLQLGQGNIRVAEYITKLLPRKILQEKLHKFYLQSKNAIESRNNDI